CEITYSPHKPLPAEGQALIERCLADCRRVGLVRDDDPVWARLDVDLPHAYVVYDHGRAEHVAVIRAWLERQDIVLAGRGAGWGDYNSDHAFLAGRKGGEIGEASRGRAATVGARPRA